MTGAARPQPGTRVRGSEPSPGRRNPPAISGSAAAGRGAVWGRCPDTDMCINMTGRAIGSITLQWSPRHAFPVLRGPAEVCDPGEQRDYRLPLLALSVPAESDCPKARIQKGCFIFCLGTHNNSSFAALVPGLRAPHQLVCTGAWPFSTKKQFGEPWWIN